MNAIKKWYYRNFKVISNKQAKQWGLKFVRNIYGDEINHINCRSIWVDKKGRNYRIKNAVSPIYLTSKVYLI